MSYKPPGGNGETLVRLSSPVGSSSMVQNVKVDFDHGLLQSTQQFANFGRIFYNLKGKKPLLMRNIKVNSGKTSRKNLAKAETNDEL